MIHVSSLSALNSVTARLHSYDLLTLLSPDYPEIDWSAFACERHLRLAFHDIVEPMPGLTAPDRDMMQAVLDFGRNARTSARAADPLLVRDQQVAGGGLCHHVPACPPARAGTQARRDLAAPDAVRHAEPADDPRSPTTSWCRGGRMVEAIDGIGRGAEAREGEPYALPLQWPIA